MTLVAPRAIELDLRRKGVSAPRTVVVAPDGPLASELWRLIVPSSPVIDPAVRTTGVLASAGAPDIEMLVYVPRRRRLPDLEPDLAAAERMCDEACHAGVRHLVLVSSTAAYGATPHHAGLAAEIGPSPGQGQPVARSWHALEALAVSTLGPERVTILRAAPTVVAGSKDFFSHLFSSVAFPIAGHDPTLQVLSVTDLARAIETAIIRARAGTFNIVPASPIPLRAALRIAGCRAVPMPWTVQRALRGLASRIGTASSGQQVQFIRYHLTASGEKAARELGFRARDTSADAVRALRRGQEFHTNSPVTRAADRFDEFGLDCGYIDASWRGVMGLLHRRYWRVEARGLEHIPRAGGGVLVGMHRGFMPFDGVMTLHSVVQGTGRVPRFLIHPGVGMRFPFLFNLMSKLGGIIACQANADRVLESGELLGVYPEGIRGAFTTYRHAHRIGPSWRNDCVAFALRHRVPIVPFVTIGSAEIFPIVGRIDWAWWKKLTEWPFIPVTSPFPLPSKWHTLVLEPLHTERDYGQEAAQDPVIVRRIGAELKRRMEAATADLIRHRKSIFWGSLFKGRDPMTITEVARRLFYIACVATRHTTLHLVGILVGHRPSIQHRFAETVSGPVRLRMMLEELGGSFIKLGQMLALQPDLVGLRYCDALFSLLDRVAPFDYAAVEQRFIDELGRSPDSLFQEFERRPLATASIGQVHVAWLDGRKLAVKVQRPEVDRDFAGDIRLMSAVVSLIRRCRLRPLYWLLEPLEEFVAWTREELDYRLEARYMERLRRNARDRPYERVPAVLWNLTTRRILVSEFLEGDTILSYLRARDGGDDVSCRRMHAAGFRPDQLAVHVIDNFLEGVFQHGMFHADLHPANLMILPGNVVGYLDFGITGVISGYSRRSLVALTLAYTRADPDGMAEAFFRVCRVTADGRPEAFRAGLKALQSSWYSRDESGCRLRKNFTLVMLDMLRLSRKCGVWPDRDVIKYIRSAIAIDGLITRMAPGFDVGHHLATVCSDLLRWQMRSELLTYKTIADVFAAGGHLMRDGVSRWALTLGRIADADAGPAKPSARGGDRAVHRVATFGALAAVSAMVAHGWAPENARVSASAVALAVAAMSSVRFAVTRGRGVDRRVARR